MARKVEVDIKTRGADKASKDLGKVDKGLGRLAKSAANAAASFFGARMLLDGFRSMINATREQILAETQLNAVLKSTAGVAGLTAKELTGMASALQKQTRFGDEAIIKAQSLMLTFTKVGKEVFPDAIEAVLNMSEAMGQDLQQGVIQVGKALNDPILGVTALRRVGVQLSDQQVDLVKKFTETGQIAEAQKIILSELETQFGGVAKAAGETMPGSLDQMKNAVGDVSEAIGKLSSPILTEVAEDVTEFAESVNDSIPKLQGYANVIGALIDKFGLFGMTGIGVRNAMAQLPEPTRPTTPLLEEEEDILPDMVIDDDPYLQLMKFRTRASDEFTGIEIMNAHYRKKANTDAVNKMRAEERAANQERIQDNLQMALLSGQSAKDAVRATIQAEMVEAQGKLISSIMDLPFPLNLAIAAGAGAMIDKVFSKLPSFATGGSFVTKGRTTLPIGNGVVVGDNASGMERIDVTPLPSPTSNGNNITINISAPLVDETVVDTIIPAIRRAEKLNL